MEFILCILQYVLIMAVILGIGLIGAAIGITLRKRKNAKEQAENLSQE